jgi:hypothetical protein
MHFKTTAKTLSLFLFHRNIFYKAQRFGNRLYFRLQAIKAPTLVNPLKRAIIGHYLQGSTRVGDVLYFFGRGRRSRLRKHGASSKIRRWTESKKRKIMAVSHTLSSKLYRVEQEPTSGNSEFGR